MDSYQFYTIPPRSKGLNIVSYVWGTALICLSIYLIIDEPQDDLLCDFVRKEFELVKDKPGYERVWVNFDMYFRVYLFHVENPDEIMEGAAPELTERGPYVYNMNIKKDVLSVDEEADEMDFMAIRTYHFNRELSKGTEDDVVTIINSAYIGTMTTMNGAYGSLLKKLGNDIPKLFPNMNDIFITAKVGNILFKGLPMECNVEKYKELKLICSFLMGKKPAVIKDTGVAGIYEWSFFERLNGTGQGPLTTNRGVKNKTVLGDTTAFRKTRVQRYWKSDECNTVKGTDAITWAPIMDENLEPVFTYEPQICRWVRVDYQKETIFNGLIGKRFELGENSWEYNETLCYCPLVKRKPVCPPKGLLDLTPCQEAPIYYSEPHYLHGDPALLEYAKGLKPNALLHSTYVIIDPITGAPMSGSKKSQLSAKLVNIPVVTLLANVSEGFFPILWAEEGKNSTMKQLGGVVQIYRLRRLLKYMITIPLVIGIFVIMRTFFLSSHPAYQIEKIKNLQLVQTQQNPRVKRKEFAAIARTRSQFDRNY